MQEQRAPCAVLNQAFRSCCRRASIVSLPTCKERQRTSREHECGIVVPSSTKSSHVFTRAPSAFLAKAIPRRRQTCSGTIIPA